MQHPLKFTINSDGEYDIADRVTMPLKKGDIVEVSAGCVSINGQIVYCDHEWIKDIKSSWTYQEIMRIKGLNP